MSQNTDSQEVPVVEPRTWNQFARERNGELMNVCGHPRTVEAYGAKKDEVLEVVCIEDPEGTHYGWIKTGDDAPRLIQPRWSLFSMQFPYSAQTAVEYGDGEIVRLRIELAEK